MAIKCVLFDLFGTLVEYDSGRITQDYHETYNLVSRLGADLGYEDFLRETDALFAELDEWSQEHEQEFSMLTLGELLFERLGLSNPQHVDEFAENYTRAWSQSVVPIKGVQTFLSRCAKLFKTALITNTHHEPMVYQLLNAHSLGPFATVTTSVTHGRPKPHPEIFHDTLSALGVTAQESVYVGDNFRADFQGALEAGLQCYLVGQHARVPREYQIPTVVDLPLHLLR